uniref:C2H2-type domain-containing protein n=1 Tax=Eptatretus burgeri TaxID=7764 RepID=A0A8C4NB27_EPTBU
MKIMNRDPTSSSDSNVGSDGGNRAGPEGAAGIDWFSILEAQNINDELDWMDRAVCEAIDESDILEELPRSCVPQISNSIRVKEGPNEDFNSPGQEKHVQNWLSSYNNSISKYDTRSKDSSQNSCEEYKFNYCPAQKSQYKCHVGKNLFPHLSQPDTHKVVHTNTKPHKCLVCKKTFLRSTYLKLHQKIHTGETSNKCSVCDKAFCTEYYMKIHQRIHSEENCFRCSICNKKFSTSSYVQKHKITCSGRKTLSCSFCNKALSSCNLQKHKKICIGEKPCSSFL